MTDPVSSAPPVPPLPPSTGQAAQTPTPPQAPPPAPNAQVLNAPAPLQNLSQALTLAGQVAQVRADGIVRILTDQGDIDLKISPQQTPLAQGETVQINLPPGSPPQTAQITPYNPPPIPPRGDATPVDINVHGQNAPLEPPPQYAPPPANATESPPPPPPLAPGQAAQLEPIPIAQVVALITPPQEIDTALAPQAIQTPIVEQVLNAPPNEAQPSLAATPLIESKLSLPAILTQNPTGFANPKETIAPSFFHESSSSINFPVTSKSPFAATPTIPQFTIRSSVATTTPAIAAFTGRAQIFHARIANTPLIPGRIQIEKTSDIETIKTITPKESLPLILQNLKAGAITGTVIAQTPEQFPIIAFPAFGVSSPLLGKTTPAESFFIIRTPTAPLAPGTEIPFIPYDAGIIDQTALTPPPLSFLTPEPWPLMEQIYQALAQSAPQAAQAFANIIPSPANADDLSSTAMFFIAAARGGDMTQWLAERTVDTLRRAGRANLISRLSDEGTSLNRLAADTVSQDWRGLSIPLFWQGDIRKIALYYKQDGGGRDGQDGAKQVRFIFDLSLDNMGKVQLDGLFRPARLDLIVRTKEPLSVAMQMKMRGAYINALAPTEVKGELSFQNKLEQWVTIKGDPRKFGGMA